ncbi:hypothetical protein PG997_005399 [Apiospora hydei]|uniref:RGS domain-containing protein n=1 Tax=Apiospora hydei TaxID=1337664 RepID=A0ABR1X4V6_9PEZI
MPSRIEPVLDHYQLDEDEEEQLRPPPMLKDYGSMNSHKRVGSNGNNSNKNHNARSVREAESSRDVEDLTSYPRGLLPVPMTKGRLRRTYSDDELSVHRGGSYAPLPSRASRCSTTPSPRTSSKKFSEQRLCGESVEFLAKVNQYQESLNGLSGQLAHIHKTFISDSSASQLGGVPRELLLQAHRDIKTTVSGTFAGMEGLFGDLQKRVEQTVFTDIYPRFVREKVALSAIYALANDRHKYQGLGDCFCLSDPKVLWHKLTTPQQSRQPHRLRLRRLRQSDGLQPPRSRAPQLPLSAGPADRPRDRAQHEDVARRPERDGRADPQLQEERRPVLEPAVHGAPLRRDGHARVLHRRAGQLFDYHPLQHRRHEGPGRDPDAQGGELPPPPRRAPVIHRQTSMPSARKALLKAFGVRVDEARTLGESGMEDQVLGRMEGQDLDAQIKEFRTAYSKYLVVKADTFVIHFYSEGVSEMLHPGNTAGLVTGQEVFRFFKANMVSKETDYRSRVRLAVRNGNPISVEIRLQTRRSAMYRGDERFVTHWTPLKDEHSGTEWVVITLAPTMG